MPRAVREDVVPHGLPVRVHQARAVPRQDIRVPVRAVQPPVADERVAESAEGLVDAQLLSLIHISEPTRLGMISYAVFCLKKKKRRCRKISP